MTLPYVQTVRYVGGYRLRISFNDGIEAELDWEERLSKAIKGSVIGQLRDPSFFARVEIWPEGRTIRWPNDADICPDVLYEWAKKFSI